MVAKMIEEKEKKQIENSLMVAPNSKINSQITDALES